MVPDDGGHCCRRLRRAVGRVVRRGVEVAVVRGIPVRLVLTLLTALVIRVFGLVPAAFPRSFYLWAWLIWFASVIAVLGWTRAHWALRAMSVIALVFTVLAAFTVVNQTYDYYPTLARLFGKNAAYFV